MSQSVLSPIRSSWQTAGAKLSTPPTEHTSTSADLASVSVASAPTQVDVDEPILFVSCFHSLEEDPEMEDELLQLVELTVKHGEIASPKVSPEPMLASMEPMSAVVEWWEPTVNPAIESDVAMVVKSRGETDGFETIPLEQNQIAGVPSTDISEPLLSLISQPSQHTSMVRSDMGLPKAILRQPPSSVDFEFVASLCWGAFGSIALCFHKWSGRQMRSRLFQTPSLKTRERSVLFWRNSASCVRCPAIHTC
jgi:hypothetical protein